MATDTAEMRDTSQQTQQSAPGASGPESQQTQAAAGSPQASGASSASSTGSSTSGGSPMSGNRTLTSGTTASSGRSSGSSTGMARRGSSALSSGARYANPFGMVLSLMDEMDQLFGSLLGGGGSPARQSGMRSAAQGTGRGADTAAVWYPQIEVTERDGNLVIRADLPGTGREDIRLEIFDDYLLLEGERRLEEEENRGNIYRSERVYGRFSRTIPLPEGVNPDEVRANFKDGVLEITVPLPNQGQQQGRQVEIQ